MSNLEVREVCRDLRSSSSRRVKRRSFVIELILFGVLSPRFLHRVWIPRLVASPSVDGGSTEDPTLIFSTRRASST